jgi:hypothetical protein
MGYVRAKASIGGRLSEHKKSFNGAMPIC